jgi:hypothetical protein
LALVVMPCWLITGETGTAPLGKAEDQQEDAVGECRSAAEEQRAFDVGRR